MKTISKAFASRLIDYAPRNTKQVSSLANMQLDGAVAAYNMLVRNEVAYIADEVGMGKTYIALGVLGLLRHVNPNSKAMIIAPRENLQRKWKKELSNFTRVNWQIEDNRFKNLEGSPVRPPIVCGSLRALASSMLWRESCDPILRMTTFSVAVKTQERRKQYAEQIRKYAPWLSQDLQEYLPADEFIARLGFALNGLLPELDLLIVDEAHNLRRGFGPRASNRNRLLAIALGHGDPGIEPPSWYQPKARRVLTLSATPFESDFGDIFRQLDVLGKRSAALALPGESDPLPVSDLERGSDGSEDKRKIIVKRLMIRRVRHISIAGEPHSKNMYRREWRNGGYNTHDEPLELTAERERLVVALIQKKVAELLGEERFKNCFQIGMLSSFESFLESFRHKSQTRKPEPQAVDDEPTSEFDLHEQTDNKRERQGIDTSHVERVARSYRERFKKELPHPKLDATCSSVSMAFETGEKALIFVRRVATVEELKRRLDNRFDVWIREKMLAELPELSEDINGIFNRYQEQRDHAGTLRVEGVVHNELDEVDEDDLRHEAPDDKGGTDTFFAWFFRGQGPKGRLSGTGFRRRRLASVSTGYSIFFDDDLVAWLLGHPSDVLATLARETRIAPRALATRLARMAYAYFEQRTRRKKGYPRLYVYESFQVAALALLAQCSHSLREKATIVLDERFGGWAFNEADPPPNYPSPNVGLGVRTFVTELQRRPSLRSKIWPDEIQDSSSSNFRSSFRRREQRRELLSAMCRLGSSYIDLYLTAIKQLGTFNPSPTEDTASTVERLATLFLDRLEEQRDSPGFSAYAELHAAASTFDTLVAVNFPDLPAASLKHLPALFANTLQHQLPVAGMSGSVNKRVVQQFRMPGFPLILASTDVLQEGEDLHTFCRRVIHYGIAWTPSAVEQRTGRVDRIDSLAQRRLEVCPALPDGDELIQVHYPHLSDTIEVLQVRRVLERINRFLRLTHRDITVQDEYESRLNVDTEILRDLKPIHPITGLLRSAFDNTDPWLIGQLGPEAIHRFPIQEIEERFEELWRWIVVELALENVHQPSARKRQASVTLSNGALVPPSRCAVVDCRRQSFTLALRSQLAGDEALVRCISPVGRLDLQHDYMLDRLYALQRDLGDVRVCSRREATGPHFDITVEEERCFHLEATQSSELRQLIERAVLAADAIEQKLLAVDAPVHWAPEEV